MIRSFVVAVQFLTRVPLCRSLVATEADVASSARFFPLVGVLVGGGGALVYAALNLFLPPSSCVLFVLIYSALVTGGFHEDGLADSIDGFGGGWTREDKLRIMRDSRIGTFGALGLIFLILAKYNLLSQLEWPNIWKWLVFANTAGRWTAIPLCLWLPYARNGGQGNLVARRISWQAATIATLTFVAVSLLFRWRIALVGIGVSMACVLISGSYYRRRLDGITGDCLGATNQITEVALYLAAVTTSSL